MKADEAQTLVWLLSAGTLRAEPRARSERAGGVSRSPSPRPSPAGRGGDSAASGRAKRLPKGSVLRQVLAMEGKFKPSQVLGYAAKNCWRFEKRGWLKRWRVGTPGVGGVEPIYSVTAAGVRKLAELGEGKATYATNAT